MAMLETGGITSAPAGAPDEPQPGPHPLVSGMDALHEMTRSRYDKLAAAKSMLEKVKNELLPLAKMGDTVSQDDVIKAAGKLVGHGLGASAVAGILADMPQDGQALAAWVAQHVIGIQQREAQLKPVLTATQHELGVHALQLLAAHSIHGQAEAPGALPGPPAGAESADPSAADNPLGASGPPGGL